MQQYTTIEKLDYVSRRIDEIGFWYVDIPRTSSTALRLAFYRRYGRLFGKPSNSQGLGSGLIPPHVPAREVRDQLGSGRWERLYTFSIIRNPFERLLSLHRFLRANGKLSGVTFSEYVRQLADGRGFTYHGHHLSNFGYLADPDGRLLVTDVFRYENRDRDIAIIAERTRCPELLERKARVYQTGSDHYSRYYDAATRRRVETLFADDLHQFGYRFEEAPPDPAA